MAFKDDARDRVIFIDPNFRLYVFNPENRQLEIDTVSEARRNLYQDGQTYFSFSKPGKRWDVLSHLERRGVLIYEGPEEGNDKGKLIYPEGIARFFPIDAQRYIISPYTRLDTLVVRPHLFDGEKLSPLVGTDWGGRKRVLFNYAAFENQGRIFLYGHPPPEIAQSDEDIEIWELDSLGEIHLSARFRISAIIGSLHPNMDAAGNFWFPGQSGLVKVFPAFLGCFEGHNNMNAGLHAMSEDAQGRIWFGSYRHGFAIFDGDKILKPPPEANSFLRILPGSFRDDQGFMHFFNKTGYGFFKTNGQEWKSKKVKTSAHKGRFTGYYLHQLSNRKLALGLYNHLGIGLMDPPYDPGSPISIIDSTKGMLLENVLTLAEDQKQRIWFGRASQGVGVYDPQLDTAVTWLIRSQKEIGALSSLVDSRGTLWLGTGQGLAYLNEPHEFDFLNRNITEAVQLLQLHEAGNGLVTFLTEHKGYLIFGNNLGFGLMNLNSFYQNPKSPIVHFFNTIDYLKGGSSEQNAVIVDRAGNAWVGNDLGAIQIDFDHLQLDTSHIYFDTLKFFRGANQESEVEQNTLKLPRGERNLSFTWHSSFDKQFFPNRWLSYHLILNGKDTLKSDTHVLEEHINLGYVPPGRHLFQLTLYKNNRSTEQKNITLVIPKNLEDTWWFWASISSFLLLIGGLIYRNKRQQQRFELETEKLKREKEEFQIQAITSSLNPHFLNNTLHWIQAKVRKDPTARLLVGNLAENIRIVFGMSRNKEAFHSLLEEMKLVENFLIIQSKRFGDKYRFLLPSEEVILRYRHIMVPLMQIQIHVENAVEWGLRNRSESTYLSILLETENQYVKIIIEDDGCGYSNAIKMNKGGTRQGTKMLKDLQNLFNIYNEEKISSRIEDNIFTDPNNGKGFGTRITILIPKKYEYEITTDKRSRRRR